MDIINFFIDTWWLWIIIVIVTIIAIYNSPEEKEKREKNRENNQIEHDKMVEYMDKYNCEETYLCYEHLYGLNIPEKASCNLWICEECLIIYYGSPIILNYSKIINVEVLNDTQIKKQYVDNTSGAIVGGLALGAIGAIIGGGTKTVTETNKKFFLTITYKSNDEIKCIIFDVTYSKVQAKKFAIDLKHKLNYDGEIVEL